MLQSELLIFNKILIDIFKHLLSHASWHTAVCSMWGETQTSQARNVLCNTWIGSWGRWWVTGIDRYTNTQYVMISVTAVIVGAMETQERSVWIQKGCQEVFQRVNLCFPSLSLDSHRHALLNTHTLRSSPYLQLAQTFSNHPFFILKTFLDNSYSK